MSWVVLANSIIAKLQTLGTAGKGQTEEAGILESIFVPGRFATLSGNLLCFRERNSYGVSTRPATPHSGCRDNTHTLQLQGPWYKAKIYRLSLSY